MSALLSPDAAGTSLPYMERRVGSWVKEFSMLYIDSPVRAGFSHTASSARGTLEEYGADLFEFLLQFHALFPLCYPGLYVGGQSYAAKSVLALATRIHQRNQQGGQMIPLKGVFMGGPFFEPQVMLPFFFEYLHTMGVISEVQLDDYERNMRTTINDYLEGNINSSTMGKQIVKAVFEDFEPHLLDLNNFHRREVVHIGEKATAEIMNSSLLRVAVHAGNVPFIANNETLFFSMADDFLTGTSDLLATLLDAGTYKVLVYNGNYDVLVSSLMVDEGLKATPWNGRELFKNASMSYWMGTKADGKKVLLGFYTSVGNLCRVVVDRAGLMTPGDKNAAVFKMLRQFTRQGCVASPP